MSDDAGDPQPTIEEMRDGLLKQLYANRAELKGVALVQGLKTLASLVGLDPGEAAGEETYTLPDLLADVNLPEERKRELLTNERGWHLSQVVLIEEALKGVTDGEGQGDQGASVRAVEHPGAPG